MGTIVDRVDRVESPFASNSIGCVILSVTTMQFVARIAKISAVDSCLKSASFMTRKMDAPGSLTWSGTG